MPHGPVVRGTSESKGHHLFRLNYDFLHVQFASSENRCARSDLLDELTNPDNEFSYLEGHGLEAVSIHENLSV